MLLAYVDESHSKDRLYSILAVVCADQEAASLAAALDDVVARAVAAFEGIPERAELHGHRLFHGLDDWSCLHQKVRPRIKIYKETMEAIAAHDVKIIGRTINLPKLRARYSTPYNPHELALQHTLERVNDYATERDEWLLVIADQVDHASTHRQNLWLGQRYGTEGYRHSKLERIVDTIHFAPSDSSRLIQAADMLAFLWHRRLSNVDTDPRAVKANRELWAVIASKQGPLQTWP